MKKIIVAGAAGFLGVHVCKRLLADGHIVIGVDNFFTGKKRNLSDLISNTRFSIISHDVTKPLDVTADYIINLACPASPIWYQSAPIETIKTSFLGTLNLLELAQKTGAVFLQASTSEVYGSPLEHPQKEEYWGNVNPIGIRSCYDEGKRAAESLCFDFYRVYGTRIKVIRIFNTYGPYMGVDDGRVVSTFVAQALSHEPITIFGSGYQTRSFCYVDDLVEGICRVLWSDDVIVGPLNIGNPHEVTLLELAKNIIDLTQSESTIIFKPLPQDDPPQRCPDIAKMKLLFDWSPKYSLVDGLDCTIQYFKKELGLTDSVSHVIKNNLNQDFL
jgi:UDP-glucuronate decarboxylase